MASKYRSQKSVFTSSNENEDYWLNQFKNKIIHTTSDNSVLDQIKSILDGKSKYESVEAAVKDMQNRAGVTKLLSKKAENTGDQNCILHKEVKLEERLPTIIVKCPNIKNTLDNIINTTRGNLPIPVIIDRTKSIHKNDVSDAKDWETDDLLNYVSILNLNAKRNNFVNEENTNLGKRNDLSNDVDMTNTDAFTGLNPVKL